MLVEDVGPLDAKILICGEAPGSAEERTGKPFVGASGKLLRQMLAHSGINPNDCYITNVVNERPPGNKFSYFYNDKSRRIPSTRLELHWKELRNKIEWLKPNVVIPVGAEPLRAITNEKGIESWRGTILQYKGTKILPTYHPAAVLRNYSLHPIAEMDFAKANVESGFPEYNKPVVHITAHPTLQQVIDWFDDDIPQTGFDIETVGWHVRCIAFAKSAGTASQGEPVTSSICIPFIKFPSTSMISANVGNKKLHVIPASGEAASYWSKNNEIVVLDIIASVLGDKAIKKVGQNSISFDAPIIWTEFGIDIQNHYMDVMHAWHVLYPELPKSLSFLCSILTNHQNYWTKKDTEDDESEWKYNAMDAAVTLEVSYKVEKELRESVA